MLWIDVVVVGIHGEHGHACGHSGRGRNLSILILRAARSAAFRRMRPERGPHGSRRAHAAHVRVARAHIGAPHHEGIADLACRRAQHHTCLILLARQSISELCHSSRSRKVKRRSADTSPKDSLGERDRTYIGAVQASVKDIIPNTNVQMHASRMPRRCAQSSRKGPTPSRAAIEMTRASP